MWSATGFFDWLCMHRPPALSFIKLPTPFLFTWFPSFTAPVFPRAFQLHPVVWKKKCIEKCHFADAWQQVWDENWYNWSDCHLHQVKDKSGHPWPHRRSISVSDKAFSRSVKTLVFCLDKTLSMHISKTHSVLSVAQYWKHSPPSLHWHYRQTHCFVNTL